MSYAFLSTASAAGLLEQCPAAHKFQQCIGVVTLYDTIETS